MEKDPHLYLVGKFYIDSLKYQNQYKRGGCIKLQRLIGEDLFFLKNKQWYFNNHIIINMSDTELSELINKLNTNIKTV